MRVPIRSILAAGAAAATVLIAVPAAAAAGTPSTTTDPAAAAAGWLAQQFVDGNHLTMSFAGTTYDDYGGTADAVFALASAKVGGTVIDGAATWLAANVDAYGDISNTDGYGPNDGGIAKLALAAEVTGHDPTSFGGYNLLEQLKHDECPTGSTTCTPGAAANIYSSVSESLVILAEARAGGAYAPSPDNAVPYFLSLQCPDGGFTVNTSVSGGCTSDPDATGYAAMALEALGGHTGELTAALDWLDSSRAANGSWEAQGGPDADSTGLAAGALAGAGRDTSASRAWLISQQMATGPTVGPGASRGAIKYQGSFSAASSPKATADAILGMVTNGSLATISAAGASPEAPVLALAAATLSNASLAPGANLTATGTGFAAGEQVDAVVHSTPVSVASATAGASGTATVTFTVPSGLDPGSHTVVLTGATSGLSSTATFTLLAAPVSPASAPSVPASPAPLAATGLDGPRLLEAGLTGLVLLLAGAGAMWLGRRRRTA